MCDKTHRSLLLSLPFAQIEISVHGSSCIHLSRLSCELLPGARHAAYCGGNLALAQRTRLCLVHNFWHLLRFVVVVVVVFCHEKIFFQRMLEYFNRLLSLTRNWTRATFAVNCRVKGAELSFSTIPPSFLRSSRGPLHRFFPPLPLLFLALLRSSRRHEIFRLCETWRARYHIVSTSSA